MIWPLRTLMLYPIPSIGCLVSLAVEGFSGEVHVRVYRELLIARSEKVRDVSLHKVYLLGNAHEDGLWFDALHLVSLQ
ncbi:hypothetical protein BDV33DRAFT_167294 [Aspergillus novoparasiticus]|uniref:Uncharacterized protein n=1 Tax=Aspergillus novoparasiticus TaxID=986946 RepID=A0A5N6F369_9EURO|nr:hypothetical protein BDV33DRAFT_167294 [Aspergillus novoparasiticus]